MPIGVHDPKRAGEQLAPLNASIKVFVLSILLPPAGREATSISIVVQLTGVAKEYQTS